MVMDPWISIDTAEVAQVLESSSIIDLGTSDPLHNSTTSSPDKSGPLQPFFKDNFQPQVQPLTDPQEQPFEKLPDSQEYLASLENKLAVIQKGGKKGATASSILESLNQVKESCMIKLLSNSVDEEKSQEEFSSEEVKVNLILKKIAPEKQAISADELVHLLKADQLDLLNSEAAALTTSPKINAQEQEVLAEIIIDQPVSTADNQDQN